MVNIEQYISQLTQRLQQAFGSGLLYVGLQGSYLRGEATDSSDMDIMVVLDRLSVSDLDAYREVIHSLEHEDKSCGFICSGDDLVNWNPLEICHLINSTRDYYGTLSRMVPQYTREDVRNFVKLSLNNLYHELCHRYIHADRDKNRAKFRGTCKSVFYLIQNLHFLESGHFILSRKELNEAVPEEDRIVLEMAELPDDYDFDQAFSSLFAWCQSAFARIEHLGGK